MTKLASLLTSMLLLWPLLGQSATYYAQSGGANNSCAAATSASTPRNSATAGLGCLSPGDTLVLRGGTYAEPFHSLLGLSLPSGAAGSPITIQSAAGEEAILKSSINDTMFFASVNYTSGGWSEYLIWDRITFASGVSDGTHRDMIKLDAGIRRWTFQHGKILGNINAISVGLQWGEEPGFASMNPNSITVLDTEIAHHSIYGIYLFGGNNLLDGNYIHDNGGYGIHHYHSGSSSENNTVIRNNRISNNGLLDVSTTETCGLLLASGANLQAYNNLVTDQFNGHGTSGDGCGIQVYGNASSAKIYNNTIVGNKAHCVRIDAGASNTDVRNNICYNNGQGISNNGSGSTISANNPNTNNPRFVDPVNANYRLQTAPTPSDALNAADNLSSIFTGDITGTVTRPATGPWDQGAYEMEAGGSSGLIPEKGTFFIDDTGTPNTTDCHAATGTVGSPSASPFGDYATARVCMLPGSTLYFLAGTYPPLDSMVTPFAGGSPTDGPTTLSAYPGATVTLQATTLNPVVVYLHNSMTDHFIILQGLILDGLNIANSNGFAAKTGVNDIRLDGVEIKNTFYEGVYLEQTANVELRNSTKVHNSASAAVGVVGLNGTTNTTITGSEVYASGGPGISSYGGNVNLLIEKSTIRNTPSGKGILLGNASTPDSGVRIANNLIYTNTHGIHFQNGTTGVGLYYNTIWNNSTACMLIDSGVTLSEAINNICWQVATLTNNAGSGMVLTTNQTTDPLFASTTPGDANFLHLCGAAGVPVAGCTGKSPAIDTGTPIPSLTSDYASKARPDGVQVDRGAFEETPVPVAPAQVGLAPVYRTTHFLTLLP